MSMHSALLKNVDANVILMLDFVPTFQNPVQEYLYERKSSGK